MVLPYTVGGKLPPSGAPCGRCGPSVFNSYSLVVTTACYLHLLPFAKLLYLLNNEDITRRVSVGYKYATKVLGLSSFPTITVNNAIVTLRATAKKNLPYYVFFLFFFFVSFSFRDYHL